MKPVRLGIAGLGFMGRIHAKGAIQIGRASGRCELRAVFSPSVGTLEELQSSPRAGNIENVSSWDHDVRPRIARSYEDLLAGDDIDAIIIATPTPLHVPMSIDALESGKHVMVEKPVALTSAEIEPLARCAGAHPHLQCVPAHVMRFWPGWVDLVSMIAEETYGRVRSAVFRRLGSRPSWNDRFYSDPDQSGAALVDLHVHDVDFIIHCLGTPDTVRTAGDATHLTTVYTFRDGPGHVTAEASWSRHASAGFRMAFTVEFERATVEFDSASDPPLNVYADDKDERKRGGRGDGYTAQLEAFVHAIAEGGDLPVTIEDAVAVAGVIDRERACLLEQSEDPT